MESENSGGGCSSYVHPRRLTKKRKRETAYATGNEKERRHSSHADMEAGSSQLEGKKLMDFKLLAKVDDDILQLRQGVDIVSHQASGLVEVGKPPFRDAPTAFEGITVHWLQNLLETLEEISTRLFEAHDVLEKLQDSVSSVSRHSVAGAALSDTP